MQAHHKGSHWTIHMHHWTVPTRILMSMLASQGLSTTHSLTLALVAYLLLHLRNKMGNDLFFFLQQKTIKDYTASWSNFIVAPKWKDAGSNAFLLFLLKFSAVAHPVKAHHTKEIARTIQLHLQSVKKQQNYKTSRKETVIIKRYPVIIPSDHEMIGMRLITITTKYQSLSKFRR